MEYTVIGKLSDVCLLRKWEPHLGLPEYEQILNGRSFARWYTKNRRMVNMLALSAPALALHLFGVSPAFLLPLLKGSAVPASTGAVGSLFSGDGVILLHFLLIGFVTLIVTTFLKFTGRGDIAPLVVFVAGGVITLEVFQLFTHIYQGVKVFLSM